MRTGKVQHIPHGHWLEMLLVTLGHTANTMGEFGYILTDAHPLQVANYEVGQKYDWHTDTNLMVPSWESIRKLTVVLQLSDAKDFTGGGLFVQGVDKSVLSEQGDVVVFPAYLQHKADTVTSGTRTTAVVWLAGPAFK